MKILTLPLKTILLILVLTNSSFLAFAQTEEKQEEIFITVESMPEYPGGLNAMYSFIAKNMVYPQQAINDSVKGKVYVNFIVEKDGSISNIKVLRGIGYGCDKEAVRVVSLFPKWKAGMQRGKNVRVSYNLPIIFKLNAIDNNKIFYTADSMPGFYGGIVALNSFINTNLRYPITIFDDKTIDTISVLFVVEKDGSISNTTLMEKKEVLNAYDFEALRSVSELPEFEPAYNNGKPVRMVLLQKIVFDYTKTDTSFMEIVDENYLGNKYSYFYNDVRFTIVESMPEYPGGTSALYNYLGKNINYPPKARAKGEQGRVFVNFAIEKDGSVSNVKVLRGVSPLIDAEAIRVVKAMPKWSPGKQKGKAVRVSYNLPIKFTLENSNKKNKRRK